jgi:TonB family protein
MAPYAKGGAWLLAALASLPMARAARAEPVSKSEASPDALTPPQAIDAGVVPYPAHAEGAATVIVELVVGTDGQVDDVRVVLGAPPFSEAAAEAAWHWRFVPGHRGDHAIAARVHMQVRFTEPRVAPPAAVTPGPAKATDVTEINVRGTKPDPGLVTVGGGEVRQIPGAFGDAFRAIDALPGVVPMASGLPYFFIRGAPPGDSGFFIDGVEVPLLFHAGVGPSVIHPSLVDHIDFFPGGAPAEYGRFVGGVLSAAAPDPPLVPHAEALVRVFDAGALAEAPFADGRGSALASGRYSYSGAVLSLVSPIELQYWDYQARATWKLDDKDQLGLFAFGTNDDFGQVVNGVRDTILDGGFHRLDLRYDRMLAHGTLRVAATLGYARSNDDHNDIQDLSLGVRARFEDHLMEGVLLRAGGDVRVDSYKLLSDTLPNPYDVVQTNIVYPPHVNVAAGAYADVTWQLTPRVRVVPGLRADVFTSFRSDDPSFELAQIGEPPAAVTTAALPALDPRLSVDVLVAPRVRAISTVAIAHEPATYLVPVPGLTVIEPDPVLQSAYELSEGVEVALPAEITFTATGFLHSYNDLTDLTATCPSVFGSGVLLGNAPNIMNSLCIVEHVHGEAFGGEFSLRRNLTKRLTGWVSYTVSRSTRETSPPSALGSTAILTIPSSFDRPNVVSALAAYDLGASWRAGVRFVAYSGLPYSNTRFYVPLAPYNGERMPAFYRFDVRLEKRWHLAPISALGTMGAAPTLALVFEGMNVTFNKEVLGEHCAPTANETASGVDPCTPQTLGPVTVPSVGLEGDF